MINRQDLNDACNMLLTQAENDLIRKQFQPFVVFLKDKSFEPHSLGGLDESYWNSSIRAWAKMGYPEGIILVYNSRLFVGRFETDENIMPTRENAAKMKKRPDMGKWTTALLVFAKTEKYELSVVREYKKERDGKISFHRRGGEEKGFLFTSFLDGIYDDGDAVWKVLSKMK